MPELPEVETWRRLADRAGVGQRIVRAEAAPDTLIMDQMPPETLEAKLAGKRIAATGRRGKHMWLTLRPEGFLYVHFGMSGSLWHLRPGEPDPSHGKLTLHLSDGTRLLYRNPRRIGKLRWAEEILTFAPVAGLGPDPLLEGLSAEALSDKFRKSKRPVKSLLLDQRFFAGVGNWIADEVLYQTGMNPFQPAQSLDTADWQRLVDRLRDILTFAVSVGADDTQFPDTWLFHTRWGKEADLTRQGEPIQYDTIGGRTCAWVPSRQTAKSAKHSLQS